MARNQEIKYKCVLSTLKKGERPCYRAIPVSNGVISLDQLCQQVAESVGLQASTIKYVIELLSNQVVELAKNGVNVTIPNFFRTMLSIRGTFDAADALYDKSKHELRLNMNPSGEIMKALSGAVGVNITEGNRCRITSVLDAVAKEEGVIVGDEDVEVYAAGGTFLVNTHAEDEGVWLENAANEVVAFGQVTASTATTLDATFATLPEPGDYYFCVATRGGLGPEYGVSIARKPVVVRAE